MVLEVPNGIKKYLWGIIKIFYYYSLAKLQR